MGPGFTQVQPALEQLDLATLAAPLLSLMQRNMSSDGYVFIDPGVLAGGQPAPANPQDVLSRPGCIVASPSYHADLATVSQNYVFNWVRDSAIVALELVHAQPQRSADTGGPLEDYTQFAALCRRNTADGEGVLHLENAKFTIEGAPVTGWAKQDDGPALQVIALLAAYPLLPPAGQATARELIDADVAFVLDNHRGHRFNLWEEVDGYSLFTRAVQLRCLTELATNTIGVPVPDAVPAAVEWLTAALATHRLDGRYVSVLEPVDARPDYDPNADVVAACIYGALACTDPWVLGTAAALYEYSAGRFAINAADAAQGVGPLIGRYPGDVYDGDVVSRDDPRAVLGHPWVVCTANYAELCYRVAADVTATGQLPGDPLAATFLAQAGVHPGDPADVAARALTDAGDRMLRAVVSHSDHFELSEQFDAGTGYEKSVRNLSWSYAAMLSALRARAVIAPGPVNPVSPDRAGRARPRPQPGPAS